MGLQLSINESSDTIIRAMKVSGENLNVDFSHTYSAPGHQGFYTEIADLGLRKQLEKNATDIDKFDFTFYINIPYEYFNSDPLPDDKKLGINLSDDAEVKAEIRCINLITKTYEKGIDTHKVFDMKALKGVINDALYRLHYIKKLDFSVASGKGEEAEKYITVGFTEGHIPAGNEDFTTRFFPVEFHLKDYGAEVGEHPLDNQLGTVMLKKKSKYEICLLRVSYAIYHNCIQGLKAKWPAIHIKFKNGEF